MELSFLVVRQVALSKTTLQRHDLHAYNVLREELLARGSGMCLHHLSVMLSVEFTNPDTTEGTHYQPDTDNQSDRWCNTSPVLLRRYGWKP